jgi:hypothetical protein
MLLATSMEGGRTATLHRARVLLELPYYSKMGA